MEEGLSVQSEDLRDVGGQISTERIGDNVPADNISGDPEVYAESPYNGAARSMTACAGIDHEPVLQDIGEVFPQKDVDIRTYSPLALAFLGDAVYSLVIRTIVVGKGNRQAEKLHNETKNLVSAHAQAAVADAIADLLTEEETRIYKRGHNSNPYHHAKNATLSDYLKATGLETLCGYLYLKGELPRFLELLKEGISRAQLKV